MTQSQETCMNTARPIWYHDALV